MRFTKMEGLGNDFLIVSDDVDITPAQVAWLCDRHFGVGADGVLRVGADQDLVLMEYWNADGSTAEMCGNGLRCVARYASETGLVSAERFRVRTPVGERWVEASPEPRVELGLATVGESFEWAGLRFYSASVGNPHAVTVVDDPDLIDVARIGAELEREVPGGVNVGFVAQGPKCLRLRVWERGSGDTLACGSGMVAATAVAQHLGLVNAQTAIDVPGGRAQVELETDTSWLIGPARFVFRGEVEVPNL